MSSHPTSFIEVDLSLIVASVCWSSVFLFLRDDDERGGDCV